jgi:hypothetical protein
MILAADYDLHRGQAAVDEGDADLIAIGRLFIAYPDPGKRYPHGWPVMHRLPLYHELLPHLPSPRGVTTIIIDSHPWKGTSAAGHSGLPPMSTPPVTPPPDRRPDGG